MPVEDRIDVSLSPFMPPGVDPQYDRYVNPHLIDLAIREPQEDTDIESQEAAEAAEVVATAATTVADPVRRIHGIFGERWLELYRKNKTAPVCAKTEELSEKLLAFLGKCLSLTTLTLTDSKEPLLNCVRVINNLKYAEDRDVQLIWELNAFVDNFFEPTLRSVDRKKKELELATRICEKSDLYEARVGDLKLLGEIVVCINNLKIMHAEIASVCRKPASL